MIATSVCRYCALVTVETRNSSMQTAPVAFVWALVWALIDHLVHDNSVNIQSMLRSGTDPVGAISLKASCLSSHYYTPVAF